MEESRADRTAERARAVGEQHEGDGGGKRESDPRREPTEVARPHEADRESDLAAGGSRQELAERHQVCVGRLVEPAAAHDELVAEISDVRNRPAEAGQAEPRIDLEYLE